MALCGTLCFLLPSLLLAGHRANRWSIGLCCKTCSCHWQEEVLQQGPYAPPGSYLLMPPATHNPLLSVNATAQSWKLVPADLQSSPKWLMGPGLLLSFRGKSTTTEMRAPSRHA